jgi:hypothetical protein
VYETREWRCAAGTSNDTELEKLKKRLQFVRGLIGERPDRRGDAPGGGRVVSYHPRGCPGSVVSYEMLISSSYERVSTCSYHILTSLSLFSPSSRIIQEAFLGRRV